MEKLKIGEQYLTAFVLSSKEGIPCFPKESKKGIKYFKGDGVTIFVNKKKHESEQEKEIETIDMG